MKTRVRTRNRRHGFETLERRTLLAGDVTVHVENGDLFVTGDDDANAILIEGTGIAGSYVIEGGSGTNVFFNNQLQGGAFIVTEATGDIVVDLNGGDDTVGINNVAVDNLRIDGDDGADVVGLGAFEALANLGLGGGSVLPTGPEVDNGTLIDNDVAVDTIGHVEIDVQAGGEAREAGFTAQGRTLLFVNEDFIFDYFSFVDVGSNGGAVQLGSTTITQPATLISPDVVQSAGTFAGENGLIEWVATTSIANGETQIQNSLTFTASQAQTTLGNLRFISYLDEDVESPDDDVLFLSGTPGSADFRVFTVDGPEGVGFAQGGVYIPGDGLQNATWDGWAADEFDDLLSAITGAGASYSAAGNVDLADLPQSVDPALGTVFGPGDVTTAFAWSVNPAATAATITTFLEFVPRGQTEISESDGSVGVNERLEINAGSGADLLALSRVFGGADWDINLGDDNDDTNNLTDANPANDIVPNVPLDDQAFIFIASGDNIDIHGGSGDDLVNINYLTAHGTLVVDGVTGNDVISINGSVFNDDVLLLGGSGLDTLAVDFSRHDGGQDALLVLDGGSDSDFILFARSLVADGEVQIRGGGGTDRVVIGRFYANSQGTLATGGNEVGTLRLDTGGDSDVADIRGNLVDEFFGVFGGGDDDVTVGFNQVNERALLDGGSGSDELFASGNIFGDVDIFGFESTDTVLSP